MEPIDRRRFLGSAAGAAAALSASGGLQVAAAADRLSEGAITLDRPPAPPMIKLGKTKIKMSRLGQGTGVHGGDRQSDQTRMGFAKLVDLMHHAYDRGIRFFDLADLYGTHVYFREALREMKRDELTILTKMWWRYDGPEDQTNLPERRQMARTALERFRHELTAYPDIVLLHCLMKPGWDQQMGPYMDVLNDAKAKKQDQGGRLLVPRFSGDANGGRVPVGRCDSGPHQYEGRQRSDDGRLARRNRGRVANRPHRTARRSSA